MERDEILARLRNIEVLPTFPAVVGEVVNKIEDPMSSAGDIARIMDPSMAGEVLRIANTAYYGTRSFRRITSIEHAVAIIGLEQLSQIMLHMPFLSMMGDNGGPDRETFVKHSLICAVVSKTISATLGVGDPGAVYIAALMHDIGSVIIYRYFQEEWSVMASLVREEGYAWVDAEREVLSCDHGVVGAWLLTSWNIPLSITEAVMYHHFPEIATGNGWNAKLIDVGNRFARKMNLRHNQRSFDEFVNANKELIVLAETLGPPMSPSRELDFFEGIFALLRSAKIISPDTGDVEDD